LSSVVTIDGRVPGGAGFQIEALGADGSVLGRSPDSTVWEATSRRPKPTSLGVRADGGLATGAGFRAWVTTWQNDLECRDLTTGQVKVISPQDAWVKWGFWASGEMIAWQDGVGQPYAARACARGRMLTINNPRPGDINHAGDIVALSDTDIFSTNPVSDKDLLEIDATTGRILARHPVPAGVPRVTKQVETAPPPSEGSERTGIISKPKNVKAVKAVGTWFAAANREVFAWAAGGALTVTDRKTWRHTTRLPVRPPAPARGTRAVMTAGDHVVVYTAKTAERGWRSVLYNTHTGSTLTIPGQAYAAGGYLLWKQGTAYRLAQVN
jgi:hypothetical protein